MEITEVRIKLVDSRSDKLRAFCSITIDDCFVIRDLKIIDGTKGAFVAMPSRKMTVKCRRCSCKNYTRAKFCNDCGGKLSGARSDEDDGRGKLHADIAHPINSECRERLQAQVLEEYNAELERAGESDYESDDVEEAASEESQGKREAHSRDRGRDEDEYEDEEGEDEEYEDEEEEYEDEEYEDEDEEEYEDDEEEEEVEEEEDDEEEVEEEEDDEEEVEVEEEEEEEEPAEESDSNDDFGAGLLS